MNLTEEQLNEIENFAGLFFTVEEVAEILELDKEKVIQAYQDTSSAFYKRYKKGYFISESKLRKSILDLALRNSSPAQDTIKKIARESRNKNMRHE